MTRRLPLGGEIAIEGADSVGGHRTTGLAVGGIYELGGPVAFLFSAGPAFEHRGDGAQLNGYAALALNF